MKVEVYAGEALAAVKNEQKPRYVGNIVHYSTGSESPTIVVVKDPDGFLEDVWIGNLRAVPATAPANKK